MLFLPTVPVLVAMLVCLVLPIVTALTRRGYRGLYVGVTVMALAIGLALQMTGQLVIIPGLGEFEIDSDHFDPDLLKALAFGIGDALCALAFGSALGGCLYRAPVQTSAPAPPSVRRQPDTRRSVGPGDLWVAQD